MQGKIELSRHIALLPTIPPLPKVLGIVDNAIKMVEIQIKLLLTEQIETH